MSVQLSELSIYRFQPAEALTCTEKTLPLYREAAGTNDFLLGIVDDIGKRREIIVQFTNSSSSSELTPVAQKWDKARTDTIISINELLNSKNQKVTFRT